MKKLLITLTTLTAAVLLFAGGAFAAATWMNYEGNDQIEQSNNNVDEIMEILRNVNEGKLTAEEAVTQLEARVQELEDMNPAALAKQNKELREQVSVLEEQYNSSNEYVQHLESELTTANEQAAAHSQATNEAVEEARNIGNEE